MRILLCLAALLAAATVWAADDRPDLNGVWLLQATDSKGRAETMSIDQKPDSIDIARSITNGAKQLKVDVSCSTNGEECKVKENGQLTQVSLYYNGPMLVMIEQRHGNDFVTKKRLKVSPDGKTLEIELVTISPPGRATENLVYTRQEQSAAK